MCIRGLIRFVAASFVVVFLLSVPALAGTDELEALIQKSLSEAKAAGAQYDNTAVGHYFIAQGEHVITPPGGKSVNDPISRPALDPWGCNERPNQVQVTNKFESRESQMEDGSMVQYIVDAHGVYNLDPGVSTEIAGTVVDKNSKPVKNAEVKAEDINLNKPPFTAHTDENGKYTLPVNSGQYRVSAKAKSCKAEQTLWACSWGKILEPNSHTERFPLDLVANCGDMDLNISGSYSNTVNFSYQGVTMTANQNGGTMKGKIPLTLDSDTGQITGEGDLHMQSHKTTASGTLPESITTKGSATTAPYDWHLRVHGQLDSSSNQASLTVECAEIGAIATSLDVTARGPKANAHASASGVDQAQSCSASVWHVSFTVPWQEGESHHVDRELPYNFEGGHSVRHEIMDLTLGEKKDDKKDDETNDGDSKPDPTSPQSGSGGQHSGAHGAGAGGGAAPSPALVPGSKKNHKVTGSHTMLPKYSDNPDAGNYGDMSIDDSSSSDDSMPIGGSGLPRGLKIPSQLQEKLPEQIQEMLQQYQGE